MVVDDIEFVNMFKGKRIKLTLKTSSYSGFVQRLNSNRTLVLTDVVNVNNGCRIPGSKLFFGRQIVGVEFCEEENDSSGDREDALANQLSVEEFQPYLKALMMGNDDEEEEHIHFFVIDDFYEKFWPAIMHIKRQNVISLGANGVELYKNGRLCWLQIATKNKVYLFDILLLGSCAFKNGLSMILESKQILKVMHDCRAIAGCLIAHFGVKLNNVFDTQVADVMCFHSETGGFLPNRVSTLQEVVNLHLKVPSSQPLSLQMMSQLTKEESEMWYKRPCPVALQKVMAQSVIHLQPLRLVLLDTLMTDYMTLVDSYLSSNHYAPDGLEHVTMESVLQLPGELKRLQQMTQERREHATTQYPVTEAGLLARFQRQTRSPSTTSPPPIEVVQTNEDSHEPSEEAASGLQPDFPLPQQPAPPPEVSWDSSLDVHVSPEPVEKPPPAAMLSVSEMLPLSSLPVGVGRGRGGIFANTMGRGRPFGSEQHVVPAMGRGLLSQMHLVHIPGVGTGGIKTPSFP